MRCSSCLGTWPGARPDWTSRPRACWRSSQTWCAFRRSRRRPRERRVTPRRGRAPRGAGATAEGARGHRPLAVLTAARGEFDVMSVAHCRGRTCGAVRAGGVEIVNVHSPISRRRDVKTKPREGQSTCATAAARGSCSGDLNTPRKELPDGSVWTFARDRSGPPQARARRALGRRRIGADPARAERASSVHLLS